jgi:hypothetical protein
MINMNLGSKASDRECESLINKSTFKQMTIQDMRPQLHCQSDTFVAAYSG